MAKQFLTNLNLNKNELQNARIQNLASAPSSPVVGQIYYNTVDGQLNVYTGPTNGWVSLAAGGNVTEAINAAITALDLANTYDAIGAAGTAEQNAKDYADGLAGNYDAAGSAASEAATAYSNAVSYADSLADDYDPAGSAATAYSNATSYTDTAITNLNLGTTYDAYGAAAAAEANAASYTDTAVANLVDGAPALLNTLNELAEALQDNPEIISDLQDIAAGKQDTLTAGDGLALDGATINVDLTLSGGLMVDGSGKLGVDASYVTTNSGEQTLTNKTINGEDNDITIVAADVSDFTTAALSATSSAYDAAGAASAAQTAAENYADGLASNYDAAGSAASAQTAAQNYADGLAGNYDPAGAADTAYNNAVSYVDNAIGNIDLSYTTDDVTEGTNLYFTQARARGAVNTGDSTLDYNSTTGVFTANTAVVATRTYVDGEISDVTTYVDGEISDLSSELTTAYQDADTTLSSNLTTAYQDADNAVVTSLTQDFQDADNTVINTLRSEISAAVQGLNVKNSVLTYSTANLNVNGTFDLSNVSGIYGGTMFEIGTRILVKAQDDSSENGIYTWTGTLSAATLELEEVPALGDFTFVEFTRQGWINTAAMSGTAWVKFSAAGEYVAGNGIDITGTNLSVVAGSGVTVDGSGVSIASDYAGQSSIDTVGTITSGTWNGSTIDVAHGGTGATTLTGYVVGNGTDALSTLSVIPGADIDGDISGNAANVTGTVAVENGGTGATTAAGARANLGATTKYAENNSSLTPASGIVTWTVSHALNTSDVTVQMRDTSTNAVVEADIVITNANTVTIGWNASATVSADSYRVVVTG